MDFGKEHDIIILGLKKLISDNGQNVFDDPWRAKALIADYFPQLSNAEKNLLNISCECGIYKMIVHSTSCEDRNVYLKAKCLLIDDYMMAESAAEITIERIFKACEKKVPDGVSKSVPKESTYIPQDTLRTRSPRKSDGINVLTNQDALKQIEIGVAESSKKIDRISKEPLTVTQVMRFLSVMSQLSYVRELAEKIGPEADSYLVTEDQMKPALDFFEEINDFERDVLMNLPKEISSVFAFMPICRDTIFNIQTLFGSVSYIAKACLSYSGKQFVVAQVPPANANAVFVVCNNMLFLDADTNEVNYLVNYCQIKGLFN